MANLILIEDDDRVRRQMEMFLAELGEENRVRSFSSFAEFESLYFRADRKPKTEPPFADHPQLKILAIEQQQWLLEQNLASSAPFPGVGIKLEIDNKTGKVNQLDPKPADDINLFGMPSKDFLAQARALEGLLAQPFQKSFDELKAKLASGTPSQTVLAFNSDKKEIWLCFVTMMKTPDFTMVQLDHITTAVAEVIKTTKESLQAKAAEESEELKLLSEIDLMVVKATFIPKHPIPWVENLYAQIKKFGLSPAKFRTRLIITKYEDDGMEKVEYIHPLVDDLVYLPLDRMIFLQKVEIILGLPKVVTPSYLFSQEVKMDIEIAKRAWIEKFSDVALVIRNPVPLVTGLIGHFFVDLPGEKESVEVYGKVIRSEPHPTSPNEFLVYFTYFYNSKEVQTKLRRHLSKDPHYRSLLSEKKEDFEFNPDDLFLSAEDKRLKNIIIVDSDTDSYSQSLNIIKENLEQVQVAAFNTYSSFLGRYFEDRDVKIDPAQLVPLSPKDFFGGQSIFILSKEEKDLVDYSPPSVANSTLLGYSPEELFKEKQAWKTLFAEKEQEALLTEIFQITDSGRAFQSIVFFNDKEGRPRAVDLRVANQPRGLQFTLNIAKQEDVRNFILMQSKFTNWDLLIIDAALMPGEPDEWVANMENNAKNRGYLRADEKLRVIIIEHANAKPKLTKFNAPQIRGMIARPIEARSLAFNISAALELPYSIYRFNNIGWSNIKLPVQVAKEAALANMAEFGAAIRHSRPIAPGTFLFLRGSIFDSAPRKNLCAKFYSCSEDPNNKGSYICSLIYFGITEAFTKFARSWFRENYAASKQSDN